MDLNDLGSYLGVSRGLIPTPEVRNTAYDTSFVLYSRNADSQVTGFGLTRDAVDAKTMSPYHVKPRGPLSPSRVDDVMTREIYGISILRGPPRCS